MNLELQQIIEKIRHLHVLYVEDEKEISDQLIILLKNFFDNIDIADNGVMGLEHFNANDYDVILTDIYMPKMNGWDMLKQMQSLKPEVFYAVLTAVNDEKCDDVRVDLLLYKPFTFNDMMNFVTTVKERVADRT